MTEPMGFSTVRDPQLWEKTLNDVNNVDESFDSARDLGYVRLNYARVGAVGELHENYDSEDIYKFQLQSKGDLALSFMSPKEESPVDFSKYDDYYKELLRETDPEAYDELVAKEKEEEAQKELLSYTAPGIKVEVYTLDKFGREKLIGDSSLEEGEELRDSFDSMIKGEYAAEKGTYYIKVTRDDTVGANDDVNYVIQASMGENIKHDYVATEITSSDSKGNKETHMSAELSSYLNGANAIQAQTMAAQNAVNMLTSGYLNLAEINSSSSWWKI